MRRTHHERGIPASARDADLIDPSSGWSGTRGAVPSFGGDDFGRLYRGSGDFRPVAASPGDRGALLGRSGSSGYRGGRPSFGEDDVLPDAEQYGDSELAFGPVSYRGPAVGAVALGIAAFLVAMKMAR